MSQLAEYEIKQWKDIETHYSNGNLVIGNGASIALHQKFAFKSLKEYAEFPNEIRNKSLFNDDVSELFQDFKTDDFEKVLRFVWHAKLVNKFLDVNDTATDKAYENIRQALISVVKEVHCLHSDIADELPKLYQFTKQFKTIVSLNYDLILYWIRMYGNEGLQDGHTFKDGFKHGGDIYWDWESLKQPYYLEPGQKDITRTFYQHGNLSIFRFANDIERKVKRIGSSNLLEIVEENWTEQNIPLFVAEGTCDRKMESIRSSRYLSKIYYEILPEFLNDGKNLVIYGWGIGEQENHLVEQIFGKKENSKKMGKVAISIFKNDQETCHRIASMLNKISDKIEVEFFDSQSSGCWNNP